jgi:hypothetical protein
MARIVASTVFASLFLCLVPQSSSAVIITATDVSGCYDASCTDVIAPMVLPGDEFVFFAESYNVELDGDSLPEGYAYIHTHIGPDGTILGSNFVLSNNGTQLLDLDLMGTAAIMPGMIGLYGYPVAGTLMNSFLPTGMVTLMAAGIPGSFQGPFSFTGGTSIVARVPEPTTLALLGLGIVGMRFRQRRRCTA